MAIDLETIRTLMDDGTLEDAARSVAIDLK